MLCVIDWIRENERRVITYDLERHVNVYQVFWQPNRVFVLTLAIF